MPNAYLSKNDEFEAKNSKSKKLVGPNTNGNNQLFKTFLLEF